MQTRMGLGLGLGMTRGGGGGAYSPASALFGAGEQGVWYDPSDFTTMFQDTAGTTPVTAVGQRIALLLDKSKGGVGTNGAFRRNLFTFTEQFGNAAWVLQGAGTGVTPTRTLGAGTSPAGVTACRLQFSLGGGTTAADQSIFRQAATVPSGAGVFSVWLRSTDGTSSYVMQLTDPVGNGQNITVTGTWQRFQVTAAASGAVINYQLRLRGGQTPANGNTADVLYSEPQVETGSTATTYQRIDANWPDTMAGNHASRTTTAQQPILRQTGGGLYYAEFDGIDDSWVTGNIDFSATDEMTVIAGVRKLSDVAAGTIVELSASSAANNGAFGLFAPGSAGPTYGFHTRGTIRTITEASGFSSPITNVLTGLSDISGDSGILRVNGAQVASNTSDQGTGNYGAAYPLYIGRRGGTTLPLNGHLFGLIVRGKTTSGADLTNAETYMAGKTGVTL